MTNNDITFSIQDFFAELLHLDYTIHGVIGPRITQVLSGNDQNPHLISPLSRTQKWYYTLYYAHPATARFVHRLGRLVNRGVTSASRREVPRKQWISMRPTVPV